MRSSFEFEWQKWLHGKHEHDAELLKNTQKDFVVFNMINFYLNAFKCAYIIKMQYII